MLSVFATGKSQITILIWFVLSVLVLGIAILVTVREKSDESALVEKATASTSERIILPPPKTEDAFLLGEYYFNNNGDGEYDLIKARKYYNQVIEDNPQANDNVWYQLGRIDFLEGKFESALYKFDKQIEYFGVTTNASVLYMIGLTHGYKAKETGDVEDWERGAVAFRKFIELAPREPWPRVDLSWIYFAQGKFDEMLPLLEEGLVHSPENPWLHNMYGLALMNTGDRVTALQHFNLSKKYASLLTTDDWGSSYPGNDPAIWGEGLEEFTSVIDMNIRIAEGS